MDVTGRYPRFVQTILCAKCSAVITRVIGNGYFTEGWVPCLRCRVDTRIVNAKESDEYRPTELLNPPLSSHSTHS
jgi:hypothetical protein